MTKLSPIQIKAVDLLYSYFERNPQNNTHEFCQQRGWADITAPGSLSDRPSVSASTMKALIRKGVIEEVARRETTSRPTRRNFAGEMGWSKSRVYVKFRMNAKVPAHD
jgi:hypothetical protein